MSTDDLTAEDEQLQLLVEERENRRQLALKEYTTWNPMAEDEVHRIATGQITRLQPTVWEREDGQCLLYPGRTHLFAGPTESCKTWAALEVMAQELHAGNAVLYVDIEDEAITAIERLRELGMTADVLTEGFLYCNPTEGFDWVEQYQLRERIEWVEHEYGRATTLAVLDSVTEGMALESLDPDRGTDVAAFYKLAPAWLASGGLAVVMIDHVPKATKKGGAHTAIGSERKRSGLTGASYSFAKVDEFGRGRTGIVEVTIDKDRPGSVRPHCGSDGKVVGTLVLVSDVEDDVVDITLTTRRDIGRKAAQAEADEERLRVAIWYKAEQQPGLTATKLLAEMEGGNDDKNRVLQQLRAEGHLRVEPGPHNAKRHYTAEPLPDDEEEDEDE